MSHTVTVTKLPDATSDDIEYEFGGTHNWGCETYKECRKEWHRHPDLEIYDGDDEWSTKRAGPHVLVEGMWTVAGDPDETCALRYVFEGCTAEEALEGVAVGETRNVTPEWDGDGWTLIVHPPTEQQGESQ